MRNHIRTHVQLAKAFEALLKTNTKFEIVHPASMGLVCFKIKVSFIYKDKRIETDVFSQGPQNLTKQLLEALNARKNIYLVAGTAKDEYFVRFSICGRTTNMKDVEYSFKEINTVAAEILNNHAKNSSNLLTRKMKGLNFLQTAEKLRNDNEIIITHL